LPLLGRLHGYRKTSILGVRRGRLTTNEFYQQLLWMPPGVRLERQALSLLDPAEYNVPLINRFQPDVLEGSGSYLAALFSYLEGSGAPMHRPKALLYTLDALPESARRLINAKFGIPVFGTYEAQEANCLAFECEQHEHYHVNIDLAAVRVVDEEARSVSPGEPGNVVVSNLVLRGTMLLNYMLEDVAAWVPGVCGCGRSLPRLGRLLTRLDDWLELPSGRRVHPHILPGVMLKLEGIWQYQVTQESPALLKVAVVCMDDLDRAAYGARLQARFKQALGTAVNVRVEFVQDVQRTPSGKVRPLISLRTKGWLERSTSP
jgi:phenylacetate-CoA ligase